MVNILHHVGTGVQKGAGYLDQVDVLVNAIPGAGQAADVLLGIGEAGLFAIGGGAKILGDLVEFRFIDSARRVVSTAVGTGIIAVPWIEHSATAEQAAALAKGDFKGIIEVQSLSEKGDQWIFEKLGGGKIKDDKGVRNVTPKTNETKKSEGVIIKTAGFLVPIIAAGKRAVDGAKTAVKDAENGDVGQAAKTAAGAAAGAGAELVGTGVVDAALAANTLIDEDGDLSNTFENHRGLADRIQEVVSGQDKDGKKLEGSLSKEQLEKMIAEKRAVGPHTRKVVLAANESRQTGLETSQSARRADGSRKFTDALKQENAVKGNGDGIQRGGRMKPDAAREMATARAKAEITGLPS